MKRFLDVFEIVCLSSVAVIVISFSVIIGWATLTLIGVL